ncbi:alpha-glucosidase [Agaribacterium haliotis]|uniref:alpha-glucosidase n=1 Tax=Agaribacterium haliotis TaxID=2013869 RepID=UPI000BB5642C|nr:alpha-glucosidase [Agaribacterium haliotis]
MSDALWWQGAIIYQIYPRSFMDANGDGIGDLRGIEKKLDYLEKLGVDALWISPFFLSPMKDFGYDIADYRQVDPMFGSLEDFDRLTKKAHERGLKIMIDQVLSHTSDQHAWFQQSQQDKNNSKADWYVWADAKADGTAPNNWLSVFGGSAWQWHEQRQQYYLHNFLSSQPDLNYHSAELRKAILGEVKFWLDRGVDGFRFDAINYCYHDQKLRDNPFKPRAQRKARGFSEDNPYAAQYHYYDNNRPEMLDFLQELRKLMDQYQGISSVGEINTEDSLQSISEYTSKQRLHLGYSFELLAGERSADYVRQTVSTLQNKLENGMACWAISNHDVERVASRWSDDGQVKPEQASMLSIMCACLRGTICVYQGEELGLGEAQLSKEQLRDPFGIKFWPEFKGRDGCRTPMPWDKNKQHAGFSQGSPWLPIAAEHLAHTVEQQQQQKNSCLNRYREFLHWRKQRKSLRLGLIEFAEAKQDCLAFVRVFESEYTLCVFNFSAQYLELDLGFLLAQLKLDGQIDNLQKIDLGCVNARIDKHTLQLPAYAFLLADINKT